MRFLHEDLSKAKRCRHERRAATWLLAAACALPALAAGAEEARPPEDASAARGNVNYRVYCLNCHGETGRGDGPMAKLLKISPADLTGIARRAGGRFPAERVFRTIDGRDDVAGHGRRGMPVWGLGFQEVGRDSDQEAEVRARIRDLVAYVESIQKASTVVDDPPGGSR